MSCSYADGGIVREGFQGESAEGIYSAGVRISKASLRVRLKLTRLETQRGGAGNVESPRLGPDRGRRGSEDIIPETALREGQENYHTGVSLSVHTWP